MVWGQPGNRGLTGAGGGVVVVDARRLREEGPLAPEKRAGLMGAREPV
jgi:hypothetical protein